MNPDERYDLALMRVKEGQSIKKTVEQLYGNVRQYRKKTTEYQRAELGRTRTEYRERQADARRNTYPRLFVETTPELRQAVERHCKSSGMSIARFVNQAVRDAIILARKHE